MRYHIFFPLTILTFVAILLGLSFQYELQAALFPWIFGSLTLAMLVVQTWKEITAKGSTKLAEKPQKLRSYVAGTAWLVGILPVIYLLGFVVGPALYCLLYFKLHGQRWWRSIWLSLLVAAVMYGGFGVGLKISLYKGLLFIWV